MLDFRAVFAIFLVVAAYFNHILPLLLAPAFSFYLPYVSRSL